MITVFCILYLSKFKSRSLANSDLYHDHYYVIISQALSAWLINQEPQLKNIHSESSTTDKDPGFSSYVHRFIKPWSAKYYNADSSTNTFNKPKPGPHCPKKLRTISESFREGADATWLIYKIYLIHFSWLVQKLFWRA